MQAITSAGTSINSKRVPALFKKVSWESGQRNLDLGGGRYDTATKFLEIKGVKNFIYDPYNRDEVHNAEVLRQRWFNTATLSNVLNVIKERSAQEAVLQMAVKYSGKLYITVYEGNQSGVGAVTKRGFQHNKRLQEYLPLVLKFYKRVSIHKGVIVAENIA